MIPTRADAGARTPATGQLEALREAEDTCREWLEGDVHRLRALAVVLDVVHDPLWVTASSRREMAYVLRIVALRLSTLLARAEGDLS